MHHGFVHQISVALGARDPRIIVDNASVNGNTSRMALERMPFDVQAAGVALLCVQFGLNDCNIWASDKGLPRVSVDAFEANLAEIGARGRAHGAGRVLFFTNHPTNRTQTLPASTQSLQERNAHYNERIRRVAGRDPSFRLVDVERLFSRLIDSGALALADALRPDGLHLSPVGHRRYFDIAMPAIDDDAPDGAPGSSGP